MLNEYVLFAFCKFKAKSLHFQNAYDLALNNLCTYLCSYKEKNVLQLIF